MNADQLLELYDRVADAPDAIPRLRRFVLDLAVRGKLVEQDAADEPASELLKRIAKEKARQVKLGLLRATKTREVEMTEPSFDLPSVWSWAALGEIFVYDAGDKRDPQELKPDFWLLELEDVEKETGRVAERLPVSARESLSTKSQFKTGDILYGKLRPYLNKVVVADAPGYSTTEIVAIRPYLPLCSEYCALALRRPDFVEYVKRLGQGTKMPRLRTEDAMVAPFPLPPLAEQHRIVAKVDELMALLDGLEQARAGREVLRDQLTAATLNRLTESNPNDFHPAAHFALQTLTHLTTRPEQIKALRQTILNLAVRGKLVEQDPADEPAWELLKRIEKERRNFKDAKGALTSFNEERFALPSAWVWTPFGNLVLSSDAGWSPKTLDYPRQEGEWGVLKVSAVSWGQFDASANKQVTPGTQPRMQAQVRRGDFLISRANTAELIARAVLVEEEPDRLMMSDKIVRLRLAEHTCPKYLWAVNNHADFAREHYFSKATGVSPSMKNVSRDVILNLPIPLPPLAEQHRIVARVDALMALCDQLEAGLKSSDTTRSRLLDAILHSALSQDAVA